MSFPEFRLKSDFEPKGSQPSAIDKLVFDLTKNPENSKQTLLGVTGSGKTFTIANVIEKVKKPTLVIAHNKTLAAQLYNEFKEFFPENRVEYFVSYYDYYQPESYIPQKDQYIEKDAQINPKIEQMRLRASSAILSRRDVIIVASVSCIYGLGSPKLFKEMGFELKKGSKIKRAEIIEKLVDIQYERNDTELVSGRFRVKGDTIDIIPGYQDETIRLELFGDEIDRIYELDSKNMTKKHELASFYMYPAKHFVTTEESKKNAIKSILKELDEWLPHLEMLKANRLKQKTLYDIEMIEETGSCKGIENYSRHFENRGENEPAYCLLDYFPDDFLIVIDESHQTIPQIRGMYKGDRSRKKSLIDYGFRLPSAYDNRPLKFEEFKKYMNNVIFVSATPGEYELEKSNQIVEQIIRPTGLLDPKVEIRPIKGQVEDIINETEKMVKRGERVLITTLTKRLSEELTEYLAQKNVKARYLHSDIDTIERTEIIRNLRLGKFDCLVGINLLREGLDIPEVGFVGILDADKEGFLRNDKSLIQTIGRAARNANSKVVLYADKITDSIQKAVFETKRRRKIQEEYNIKHDITPKTIVKPIRDKVVDIVDIKHIPKSEIPNVIVELESEMYLAAEALEFERAIQIRDKIAKLKKKAGIEL
ncbi:excinuclease ABC, B subunit [Methanococcus vannielii SB]|uniref:UvrABC system protein B n=1 Tax=Methanococcus vannielii (strain ATCC 35089 / DSM 1224 / JCM 13029 / OCM 148 / SB) TaxID=406327 RepID=A6USL9_METVS|nr:excinuclease ABC subunit UvrB [Methanococcus vannielii]ABR55491.1 excinuclease ABC, B subunit [Methanococcus vannielii SB]